MDEMLTQLFGIGWTNLVLLQPGDNTPGNLFGVLFGLFNAAIGGILVGIFFIIGSQAIADTAESGSIMGDKKPSWFLIRSITAAAMIMPLVKGFSLLQVLILSLVVNFSVLLANSMASATMVYLLDGNNTFTDPIVQTVDGVAEQMLMTSVCSTYFNDIEYASDQGGSAGDGLAITKERVTREENNGFSADQLAMELSFNGVPYTGLGPDACGRYVINCQDASENSKTMCEAQMDALEILKRDTDALAQTIISGGTLPGQSLARAKLDYEERLRVAIRSRVAAENGGDDSLALKNELIEKVQNGGFIYLGQWYMTLTGLNQKISNFAKPNMTTQPIDLSSAISSSLGVEAHLNRAASYVDKRSVYVPIEPGAEDEITKAERRMAGLAATDFAGTGILLNNDKPLNLFGQNMTENFGVSDDPIIGLQKMGDFLITTATGASIAGAVGGVISPMGTAKSVKKMLSKKGKKTNQGGLDLSGVAGGVGGFASAAMLALFLCGLILLYYVPLIPFILWTFGVVAYLIIIIESLIAAPLWAASHALPRGDGFISDQAKQGYALLLNLAIRPPIMVLGLMAGGILMLIVTPYVIKAFEIYSISIVTNRMEITGLITFVVLTIVMVMFVVGVFQKTHSLIWEAGDRVIAWVTSASRPTNDIGDERNLALMVGQARGTTGSAMDKASSGSAAAMRGKTAGTPAGPRPPSAAGNQKF